MKKTIKKSIIISAAIMAAGLCFFSGNSKADAKVKVSVKANTLTVSGKGALKGKVTVKNPGKIKNIVIKKGVKSVSRNAFSKFKNLKLKKLVIAPSVKTIGQEAFACCRKIDKVVMPGNFKVKEIKGDDAAYQIFSYIGKRTGIGTVKFNTAFNINNVVVFYADNLEVKKNDKNYKSISGVVYSKDGKKVMAVPARRKEITLADGCEEFCISSVRYSDRYENRACEVNSITIPASVKRVSDEMFTDSYDDRNIETVNVNSEQLDLDSLYLLNKYFACCTYDYLLSKYPNRLERTNDMFIYDKKILLKYSGNAENVTIPEGITGVYKDAFVAHKEIKSVTFPNTLEEILNGAFLGCDGLTKINWGTNIRQIGDEAFRACSSLADIVIPAAVTSIGKQAFEGTIWTVLDIPANVKYIGDAAFWNLNPNIVRKVTIHGDSKDYSNTAFNGGITTVTP